MKKTLALFLSLLCLALCACGAVEDPPAYPIDYCTSQKEFAHWEGCEMHAIRYGGDGLCNETNLAWLNELAEARGLEPFSACICFFSDFHSPKEVPVTEAWNPDEEYTDWSWWLGRSAGGDWVLVDWGYG